MAACDHCHVSRALTLWAIFREDGTESELDLCGHASDQHATTLVTQGWALIEDERVDTQ